MNIEYAEQGSAFFTPAGRIHAIGAGVVLAEIQQTSDITYRIFDWNRKNLSGESRELHIDLAADAIDFAATGQSKIIKELILNKTVNLVNCEFFNTNILSFDESIEKDYNMIDSFVLYICVEGEFIIRWDGNSEPVLKGETVLLPAMIKEVVLEPVPVSKVLEIYIKKKISFQPTNN
jgi:mannose-6-phosphate isomerase